MKTENEKCGEIFRCGPGKFIFSCAYCSEVFDSKTIALDHIENHFLIEIACSTNDIKTEELNLPPFVDIKRIKVAEPFSLDPLSNLTNLSDTIKQEPEFITNEDAPFLIAKQNTSWTEQKSSLSLSKNKRIVGCDICGKMLLKSSMFDHMRIHKNLKKFKCFDCPKKFNTKPGLFKHSKIHRDPEIQKTTIVSDSINNLRFPRRTWGPTFIKGKVECDICKKKMQKDGIKRHMSTHTNLKEFSCSVCQKTFNNRKQLEVHETIHSGIKEHSCHICAAQFRLRPDLIAHIRVHTGEKPYKCNVCEKKLSSRSSLKEHLRIHTGEKPYTCELCGKTFRTRFSFKSHMSWHNQIKTYKCDFCTYAFVKSSSLREHRRKHTGERPFTCGICNQSFKRSYALRQHSLLHTGEKQYKCRFCDSKFAQGAGRRIHERSAHQDPKKKFTIFGIVDDTT